MPALIKAIPVCAKDLAQLRGGPICHKGFVAGLGCSEVSGGAHASAVTAQFLHPSLVFSSAAEHALGPCHCRLKASSLHSVDMVPCK